MTENIIMPNGKKLSDCTFAEITRLFDDRDAFQRYLRDKLTELEPRFTTLNEAFAARMARTFEDCTKIRNGEFDTHDEWREVNDG